MSLELWPAAALAAGLVFYALLGGADFGGGVWDLLARGPRARAQRRLVTDAIGPVWEANHVWLIAVVVILFSCFPPAFAAIATALHVPLMLLLVGIVLRGSAFTFRLYDTGDGGAQERWGRVFAVSSTISPVFLGVTLGAIASGRIRVQDGVVSGGFVAPWLFPFPFAVGALALALFAFLAATYLAVEARDGALREDFRRRALGAGLVADGLAALTLALARDGAPVVYAALVGSGWSPLVLGGALAVAGGALVALARRRFYLARAAAAAQVTLVIGGWALAQHPYLVVPDLTIAGAAAPARVLRLTLGALAAGAVLLFPSLVYLFRVFKGRRAFAVFDPDPRE